MSDQRTGSTSETPSPQDWSSARGDKWGQQLAGLEAMMSAIDTPLTRALELDAPYRVADLGCGGGGTTLEIARIAPAGSVIHGFDISPRLVELARARSKNIAPALVFEVADLAQATPEQPYQRLLSRFSTMFFADPPRAFANVARWLEPGGRFAFAVWGPPDENAWLSPARAAVAEVLELPPVEPDAPGPFRYADVSKLLDLLRHSGFTDLAVRDFRAPLPVGGELAAADAARFALAAFSSFAELLERAGADALSRAQHDLTARFTPHYRDGAVRLEACVHIVTGSRA